MAITNRERRVQFELRPAVFAALGRELQRRGESVKDRGAMGRLINDLLQQIYFPVGVAVAAQAAAPTAQAAPQAADDDDGFGFDTTQL